MSQPPEQPDDALSRVYRERRPEPPGTVDDAIRAAAAAAVERPPARRWRYPVGVGAAAAALLAVLLFIHEPEVRDAIDVAGRTERSVADAVPLAEEVAAPTATPAAVAQSAEPKAPSPALRAVRPVDAPTVGPDRAAPASREPPWCDAPQRHDGPFAGIDAAVALLVCRGETLRVRADGGACRVTFERAATTLEIATDPRRVILRDADGTLELTCRDGAWVVTDRPPEA